MQCVLCSRTLLYFCLLHGWSIGNKVGYDGATQIGEALKVNTTLISVNLGSKYIVSCNACVVFKEHCFISTSLRGTR